MVHTFSSIPWLIHWECLWSRRRLHLQSCLDRHRCFTSCGCFNKHVHDHVFICCLMLPIPNLWKTECNIFTLDGNLQWNRSLVWNVLHGKDHEKIQKTFTCVSCPFNFPLHCNWIQCIHEYHDAY